MNCRYIIVEAFDHLPGGTTANNCATITEIRLYDPGQVVIPYSPTVMYDSHAKGDTTYWNSNIWGKSNLNNGNLHYIDNATGQKSTTYFYGPTSPNSGHFVRFVLDLGSNKDVRKIDLWAGSPERRIPKHVKFYGAQTYSFDTNIKGRLDTGLTLLSTHLFDGTESSVRQIQMPLKGSAKILIEHEGVIKHYNNGWNAIP